MRATKGRLTSAQRKLFTDANFGHFVTLMPDGAPHAAPVWVDIDDGNIVVNTAEGRVKERNLREDARVAISITDQDDPYKTVSVSGRVVDVTREAADEHIDVLAKKYLGKDRYPFRSPGERRVKLIISPERVASSGV